MACCRAQKEVNDWCRKYPIVFVGVGHEYCIFHAPKEYKRDPATGQQLSNGEFNKLVYEEIDQAKKESRKCDFSGATFPGYISLDKYDRNNPLPEISFAHATFSGEADFSNAMFSDKADFWETTFSVKANFRKATFGGKANFDYAKIYEADFSYATFTVDAEVVFHEAMFSHAADFRQATFGVKADFHKATFSGKAYFHQTTFGGEGCFWGAKFYGSADFWKAQFIGIANFESATFKKADFMDETFLKNASINFSFLKIEESITFTGVRMRNPSFASTDLRKCEFISCQWDEKDGRNLLRDETDLIEAEKRRYGQTIMGRLKRFLRAELYPFDIVLIGMVEDAYRHMKVKYKDMHDESEVSKWHASEKEMQRKKVSIIRNPFDWFLLNIYRALCGYGENSKRAFLVLVFMLLVFLILFSTVETSDKLFSTIVRTLGCAIFEKELVLFAEAESSSLFDTFLCPLQYAIFEKDPYCKPETMPGRYLVVFIKLFVPIQATLLIFALRNRFRR